MDGAWLRLYNIIFCYIYKSVFIMVGLALNRAHGLKFGDASHLSINGKMSVATSALLQQQSPCF